MRTAEIGIIGGTGLYQMESLTNVEERKLDTPFGPPSDTIVLGTLEGRQVAFLPRHGRGHRILPTEVPYRANIYALKLLGVERIVSVNAVGSLCGEMAPMDIVVPDQLIDCTRHRVGTFFGEGIAAHVGFSQPFCPEMRKITCTAGDSTGANIHERGTFVVMEGPQFSTLAESMMFQSLGANIIGMTALPEAKLAREAEMCYVSVAFVTDYDCWHPTHESVTTEMIIANLLMGAETARVIVRGILRDLPADRSCCCGSALSGAIVTPADLVPEETKEKLSAITGRYLRDATR